MMISGLVDLQVNGFMGIDFSAADLSEDGVVEVCRSLASRGTAAFLATVITSSEAVYQQNLPILARVSQRVEFHNQLLGIHLEGPFINEVMKGAQNSKYIKAPDIALMEEFRRCCVHGEPDFFLVAYLCDCPCQKV